MEEISLSVLKVKVGTGQRGKEDAEWFMTHRHGHKTVREEFGGERSTVSQLEQCRILQGSRSRPQLTSIVLRCPEFCMSKPQAACPSQPHRRFYRPSSHGRCHQVANSKWEQKGSPTWSASTLSLQQFGPWMRKWETFPFFLSSLLWDIWKFSYPGWQETCNSWRCNFFLPFQDFLLLNIALNT